MQADLKKSKVTKTVPVKQNKKGKKDTQVAKKGKPALKKSATKIKAAAVKPSTSLSSSPSKHLQSQDRPSIQKFKKHVLVPYWTRNAVGLREKASGTQIWSTSRLKMESNIEMASFLVLVSVTCINTGC